MITVRMVYAGMRFENDVPDETAAYAMLAAMFAAHGITAAPSNPMAGRVNVTGARARVQFIVRENAA